MEQALKKLPRRYHQPDNVFSVRQLNGVLEDVSYIPESHNRLWYNIQDESYERHHHSAMEIINCLENCYEVTVKETRYVLNSGDFLFIPPHTLHELHPMGDGIRYICLVDLEPVHSFHDYQAMAPMFLDGYLLNKSTLPGVYDNVVRLFNEISDIYFSNRMLWESSAYMKLMEIFTLIGREYYRNQVHAHGQSEHASRDDYETVAAVLSYIDTHFGETISLDKAAELSGFSKYYFSRLFKQITNTTFCDYLVHKRISAAQTLLATDMPITDIAFQAGFNNLTSFNRSFRKCTGCSPSEYRSRVREEQFGEKLR